MKSVTEAEVFNKYPTAYFKNASTFGALTEETISWLFTQGRIIQLDTHETLFETDEHGDNFFVILKGSFAYYKCHQGQYAFIRDYKMGEQVGFMSMIALHNRVGTAIANEESLVLEISNNLFQDLYTHAPADFGLLMMNLSREMARTLRAVDNLVVIKTLEATGQIGLLHNIPAAHPTKTMMPASTTRKPALDDAVPQESSKYTDTLHN